MNVVAKIGFGPAANAPSKASGGDRRGEGAVRAPGLVGRRRGRERGAPEARAEPRIAGVAARQRAVGAAGPIAGRTAADFLFFSLFLRRG